MAKRNGTKLLLETLQWQSVFSLVHAFKRESLICLPIIEYSANPTIKTTFSILNFHNEAYVWEHARINDLCKIHSWFVHAINIGTVHITLPCKEKCPQTHTTPLAQSHALGPIPPTPQSSEGHVPEPSGNMLLWGFLLSLQASVSPGHFFSYKAQYSITFSHTLVETLSLTFS